MLLCCEHPSQLIIMWGWGQRRVDLGYPQDLPRGPERERIGGRHGARGGVGHQDAVTAEGEGDYSPLRCR